ncbi:hypothetical protein Mapa_014748 [Marchantia paleacea]|nr:hypothetical protein Mapa_014748 [Marchantia paleacea]
MHALGKLSLRDEIPYPLVFSRYLCYGVHHQQILIWKCIIHWLISFLIVCSRHQISIGMFLTGSILNDVIKLRQ